MQSWRIVPARNMLQFVPGSWRGRESSRRDYLVEGLSEDWDSAFVPAH